MGRKYTVEELKAQDPEKWTDEYIQEWGSRSGKVEGIERGSSGPDASGATQTQNLRRDTDKDTGGIRQTDSMRLVGNAGAGRSRINASQFSSGSSALIYDDVTGNVYATDEWKDVSRNEQGWIDARGLRFKGWASGYGTEGEGDDAKTLYGLKSEGEISYEARKKGGHNMLAVFGDGSAPEAGTAEFQDWVREEVRRSAQAQARDNMYNAETGKFGESGTDYGRFGSISAADWVKLGRPTHLNGHTIDKETIDDYAQYTDAQLSRSSAVLGTKDTKKRKSGLGKSLGFMGKDFLKVATQVTGAMKGFAPVYAANKVLSAAHTYEQTGGSWEDVGKQAAISTGTDIATAALSAATAGIGGVASGGAGAAAGASGAGAAGAAAGATATLGSTALSYVATIGSAAAQGAIVSGGQALAESALTSVFYGGYDHNKQMKGVGRAALSGAATGAVTAGAGRFFQTSPTALRDFPPKPGSWQTGVAGELFNAAVSGSSAYGVARLFGKDEGEAATEAMLGSLSGVATAFGGWAHNVWRKPGTAAFSRTPAKPIAAGFKGFHGRLVDNSPAYRTGALVGSFPVLLARDSWRNLFGPEKNPGGRPANWVPEERRYV